MWSSGDADIVIRGENVLPDSVESTNGGDSLTFPVSGTESSVKPGVSPPARALCSGIGWTNAKHTIAMMVATVAQALTKDRLIPERAMCKSSAIGMTGNRAFFGGRVVQERKIGRRRHVTVVRTAPGYATPWQTACFPREGGENRLSEPHTRWPQGAGCFMRRLMSASRNVRSILLSATLTTALLVPTQARAGVFEAFGPNSDFPDSNLVMPFVGKEGRIGFFSISNLGLSGPDSTPVPVTWEFYDESGELVVSVQRYILGEGGTDIVDITQVQSKAADGTLGPATNLAGRDGFVVVSKDDGEPDLVGNYSIASTSANSGFGGNGAGLGFVGILATNSFLFGTSFAPSSLGDNMLMILGIDDFGTKPTSLTQGDPPSPGETVFVVEISLHSNTATDGLVGSVEVAVPGSALFTSLQELFPAFDLDSSVSIVATPLTAGVSVLGFYGQAVGQFGAGQSLRTDLPIK